VTQRSHAEPADESGEGVGSAAVVFGEHVHGLVDVGAMRGCGRALTQLHHTIDLLGRQNYPPATSFAAAARPLLPASA